MADALKIGLAGVGTVGGGLLQLLAAHGQQIAARAGRPIKVIAVSTLEDRRNKAVDISKFRRAQDPVALAADPEIDVFVELMGGEGGVAKASVEAALRAGKHVVTANKAMLAHHGAALATLAEKQRAAVDRLQSTHSIGSWTVKRAPSTIGSEPGDDPGFVLFSAQMRPRCASMICLVIDRPRPEFWPKSHSSPRSV